MNISHKNISPLHRKFLYLTGIIYKIKCKKNKRVYIGKAVGNFNRRYSGGRWYEYTKNIFLKKDVEKYGVNNFSVSIIEHSLSRKNLVKRERYYIRKYNSNNFKHGYNLTDGEYIWEVFRKNMKGVRRISPTGETKEYKSTVRAVIDLYKTHKLKANREKILLVCKGERFTHMGFGWQFLDDVSPFIFRKRMNDKRRPVYQMNFSGDIIRIYSSPREAANKYRCSYGLICAASNGKIQSAVGFLWRYIDMYDSFRLPKRPMNFKRVSKIRLLDNKIIKIYNSVKELRRELKCGSATVCYILNNRTKKSKFVEDGIAYCFYED